MTSYVGQSLAVIDSNQRVVGYSKKSGATQMLKYYTTNDKTNKFASYTSLGHCNGMCYANGYFYVCSYLGSKNTKKVTMINANTLKNVKTINLPVAVSALGYDGTFVGGKDKNVYIFDENFKVKKKFTLKYTDGTNQDIEVYKDLIYVCRSYVKGSISAIDIYDFNGVYKGSLTISANELESCDFDENGVLHYITWNAAKLVKTDYKR